MAAQKRSAKSSASTKSRKKPAMPARIYAQASPHSVGGESLFAAQSHINAATVPSFFSERSLMDEAVLQLEQAGFDILQISPVSINIAGTQETYEQAFKTDLYVEQRPVIKRLGEESVAEFIESRDAGLPGLISTANTSFANVLEGVALEEPRYFLAPSPYPPRKAYWHLRVPGDVSLGCNAERAHRGGTTGRGVRVAMVDSGWYKHPFFVEHGYRASAVVLGPAAANPLADENGHGTAESANIFAVAPDIDFLPVKMNFVNSIGAFNTAVGLGPQIITCSWGSDKRYGPLSAADQSLAAAIASAVASGIVVVFSAGNGQFGFPGQHPDVISAGGVFLDFDETLQASNYASGFVSNIYPGRQSPDLCGLVGMQPSAIYIMLPVEPGDTIDVALAGNAWPTKDETTIDDGWAAISGTSAAAPQLAGAAALLKQVSPNLLPNEVRDILLTTSRDVTTGNCNVRTGGAAATVGPDTATGSGLVDAQKAVLVAKIRAVPVEKPLVQPGQRLSLEDVRALEEMVLSGELDESHLRM